MPVIRKNLAGRQTKSENNLQSWDFIAKFAGCMKTTLTIDQGNSSAKLTHFHEGKKAAEMRSRHLTVEETADFISSARIDGAIYSSVAAFDIRLVESLRQLTDGPVVAFTHSTPLPIKTDYTNSETLGLDRVAAAVGAAEICRGRGALIADAGTALTTDIIDSEGTFLGGNISPGVGLRLRSLHNYTSRLPEVGKQGDTPVFGHDTDTAIRSGAIRGTAAEILRAFHEARRHYAAETLVLTGGDSSLLLPYLAEESGKMIHEPDLVALGLNRILLFSNEKETKSDAECHSQD